VFEPYYQKNAGDIDMYPFIDSCFIDSSRENILEHGALDELPSLFDSREKARLVVPFCGVRMLE
jgi:hypothetical protein